MEIEDDREAKRQKSHEAHMMPGIRHQRLQWGFPKSLISTLRYCDTITMASTTGAIVKQVFCANGIYDPDTTGVGHQPMWRDNFANVYNNYVVLGSKITVHYTSRSTDKSWIVGIISDDGVTISSTLSTIMESNNSVWTVHGTSHAGPTKLSHVYEPLADIGIDAKDDGDMNQTTMGANPVQVWSYIVYVAPIDGASTSTLDLAVQIEYTVKFNELLSQSQN